MKYAIRKTKTGLVRSINMKEGYFPYSNFYTNGFFIEKEQNSKDMTIELDFSINIKKIKCYSNTHLDAIEFSKEVDMVKSIKIDYDLEIERKFDWFLDWTNTETLDNVYVRIIHNHSGDCIELSVNITIEDKELTLTVNDLLS